MCNFSKLSDIVPKDDTSWKGKIFLTFDLDWAHDVILEYTLSIVKEYDLPCTLFVTNKSNAISEFTNDPNIELGIHPNFNILFQSVNTDEHYVSNTIDNLLSFVPDAVSVRSHSITYNGILQELFTKFGLTHESNSFIPWQSGISLKPWNLWNGLTRVPYFWEDDVACLYGESAFSPDRTINGHGINVFCFHPIHVFLNTEDMSRYQKTREYHQNPKELEKFRFEGYGTKDRLLDILKLKSSI